MSDGCGAPEQTAKLPAGIDLAKEIVLGGKVTVDLDDKGEVQLSYTSSSAPPPPEGEDEEQVETLES